MLWIMYYIIKIGFYQFFPCEPTFVCLTFIFRTYSELGKIYSFYCKVYYQIRVQIVVIPKAYPSVVAKKICKIVKDDNNIEDDLYERVKAREKIASTDYAYKTAVPHPDRLLVDDTYICMAILEKPIMWELQEVCIVVLVLIGRRDKDKVQEFYQLFAQFLMDENKVDKLIRSRSKEKLLELINKMKED